MQIPSRRKELEGKCREPEMSLGAAKCVNSLNSAQRGHASAQGDLTQAKHSAQNSGGFAFIFLVFTPTATDGNYWKYGFANKPNNRKFNFTH